MDSLQSLDGIRIEQQVETVEELPSGAEARNRFAIYGLAWPDKAKEDYPKLNHLRFNNSLTPSPIPSPSHSPRGSPKSSPSIWRRLHLSPRHHFHHGQSKSPQSHHEGQGSHTSHNTSHHETKHSHSLFHKDKDEHLHYDEQVKPFILDPLFYTLETSDLEANHKPLQFRLFTVADGGSIMIVRRKQQGLKHELEVFDCDGLLIGTIRKHFSVLKAQLEILDKNQHELLWLKGPKYSGWNKLGVFRAKDKVGFVTKKWNHHTHKNEADEEHSDIDSFDVFFPSDADLNTRALLMAAVLFLDLIWFD